MSNLLNPILINQEGKNSDISVSIPNNVTYYNYTTDMIFVYYWYIDSNGNYIGPDGRVWIAPISIDNRLNIGSITFDRNKISFNIVNSDGIILSNNNIFKPDTCIVIYRDVINIKTKELFYISNIASSGTISSLFGITPNNYRIFGDNTIVYHMLYHNNPFVALNYKTTIYLKNINTGELIKFKHYLNDVAFPNPINIDGRLFVRPVGSGLFFARNIFKPWYISFAYIKLNRYIVYEIVTGDEYTLEQNNGDINIW